MTGTEDKGRNEIIAGVGRPAIMMADVPGIVCGEDFDFDPDMALEAFDSVGRMLLGMGTPPSRGDLTTIIELISGYGEAVQRLVTGIRACMPIYWVVASTAAFMLTDDAEECSRLAEAMADAMRELDRTFEAHSAHMFAAIGKFTGGGE